MCVTLAAIFTKLYQLNTFPREWGNGIIRPIHKAGNTTTSRAGFTGCSSSFGSVGLPSPGTKRGKGPGGAPPKGKRRKRRGPATLEERMCHDQTWPPITEERMELARVGLGLKELQFGVEDGAEQIHQRFLSKYALLEAAGGYTVLRTMLKQFSCPSRGSDSKKWTDNPLTP